MTFVIRLCLLYCRKWLIFLSIPLDRSVLWNSKREMQFLFQKKKSNFGVWISHGFNDWLSGHSGTSSTKHGLWSHMSALGVPPSSSENRCVFLTCIWHVTWDSASTSAKLGSGLGAGEGHRLWTVRLMKRHCIISSVTVRRPLHSISE